MPLTDQITEIVSHVGTLPVTVYYKYHQTVQCTALENLLSNHKCQNERATYCMHVFQVLSFHPKYAEIFELLYYLWNAVFN